MEKGRWYLVYTFRNTFEPRGGTIEQEEIPLESSTEGTAMAEAQTIFEQKKLQAIAEWEKQKKTWVDPPATAFCDGPWKPALIYKIDL